MIYLQMRNVELRVQECHFKSLNPVFNVVVFRYFLLTLNFGLDGNINFCRIKHASKLFA